MGRSANHVKNQWNTRLRNRLAENQLTPLPCLQNSPDGDTDVDSDSDSAPPTQRSTPAKKLPQTGSLLREIADSVAPVPFLGREISRSPLGSSRASHFEAQGGLDTKRNDAQSDLEYQNSYGLPASRSMLFARKFPCLILTWLGAVNSLLQGELACMMQSAFVHPASMANGLISFFPGLTDEPYASSTDTLDPGDVSVCDFIDRSVSLLNRFFSKNPYEVLRDITNVAIPSLSYPGRGAGASNLGKPQVRSIRCRSFRGVLTLCGQPLEPRQPLIRAVVAPYFLERRSFQRACELVNQRLREDRTRPEYRPC